MFLINIISRIKKLQNLIISLNSIIFKYFLDNTFFNRH